MLENKTRAGPVTIKLHVLNQRRSWRVLEVKAKSPPREHPSLLTLRSWYYTLYAWLYVPVLIFLYPLAKVWNENLNQLCTKLWVLQIQCPPWFNEAKYLSIFLRNPRAPKPLPLPTFNQGSTSVSNKAFADFRAMNFNRFFSEMTRFRSSDPKSTWYLTENKSRHVWLFRAVR